MLEVLQSLTPDERKPNHKVDISDFTGKKDTYSEFREPRIADLYPDTSLVQRLKVSHPFLLDVTLNMAIVMGKCYVKTQAENHIDPIRVFANLADKNEKLFVKLSTEFSNAFIVNYRDDVEQAGNDSTE